VSEVENNETATMVAILNSVMGSFSSKYYFEIMTELDEVRRLVPAMPEPAFDEFLRTRHGRVLCADCPKAARFWERNKIDSYYKRPLCATCMDRITQKLYERKQRTPESNRYKVTAAEARFLSKNKGAIKLRTN
jgi:hypothetical protein